MDHLSEGQLQAYLDGEVESAAAHRLATHLEACAVCIRTLASMRAGAERAARALVWLDRPVSTAAAMDGAPAAHVHSSVAEVAGAHDDVAARRIDAHRPWRRPARVGFLKAAMLALFASGAAAAAIPGSPVQRWLGAAWERLTAPEAAPDAVQVEPPATPESVDAPAPEAPAREMTSISIEPVEGTIRVMLVGAQQTQAVRVVLVDAPNATVEADAAANTRFSTGPSRIQASGLGTGIVTVFLPRSLAQAVVEADGQVLLEKDGTAIRTFGTHVERSGDSMVFRLN